MDSDPYRQVGLEIGGYNTYRLIRFVGAGAMGAVFYAFSPVRGYVAIKMLKPDIAATHPHYIDMFSREVSAVRALNHPNIVRIIDEGKTAQGIPFMAMEWLGGETLDQVLNSQLPLRTLLRVFEQIGSAVAYAHQLKRIHLDLKPENIFLIEVQKIWDVVKVIDFGLSRVLSTYSGTTVTHFRGSLHYCSPEHFGGRVSTRSDIYSLGIILYHMLTGVLPIGATYIAAKQGIVPVPKLPPLIGFEPQVATSLEQIVDKAIKFNPEERYQNVDELLTALRDACSLSNVSHAVKDLNEHGSDDLAQEVFQRWLVRDYPHLEGLVESRKVKIYEDYDSTLVIVNSKSWKADILVKIRVHAAKEFSDDLLSDLVSRIDQIERQVQQRCLLGIAFADPLEAQSMGKQAASRVKSSSASIMLITGWVHVANKCFYPVHRSSSTTYAWTLKG